MIEVYRRPMQGTQPEYRFPPYGSTAKRAPTKPLVMLPLLSAPTVTSAEVPT